MRPTVIERDIQESRRTTISNLGGNLRFIGQCHRKRLALEESVRLFVTARKAFLDKEAKKKQRGASKIELLPTEVLLDLVEHMRLEDSKRFSMASKRCRTATVRRIFERVHSENRPTGDRLGRAIITSDVRVRSWGGTLQCPPGFNLEDPMRPFIDIGIIEAVHPFGGLRSLEIRDRAALITSDGVHLDIEFRVYQIKPICLNHARLSKLIIKFEDDDEFRFDVDIKDFFLFLGFCERVTATVETAELKLSLPFQNLFKTIEENAGDERHPLLIRLPSLRHLPIRSTDIIKHPVIPIRVHEVFLLH
ncbi:hypothetical protein TWF788_011016 [Orbilia oligospora]|uniref:F-box domain-containing protein n=1 Tax=Orbilia oligospora TaxID=2813651 RepID=A0A7C8PHE3_ORBOL|nr:hypothetical protein TWF788_011016 [Orbilia oligospora]